ncbi:MAG: hypothetical protein V3U79_06350 [Dehalococcoidia bacterium]
MLECLIGKLGPDVVQELKEGVRQASVMELVALESCLAAFEGGE